MTADDREGVEMPTPEALAEIEELFDAAKAYANQAASGDDLSASIDRLGARLMYLRDHLPALLDRFAAQRGAEPMPTDDERRRVAMLLGFDPEQPETWYLGTIDRLIAVEKHDGNEALYREIQKLMTPPPKRGAPPQRGGGDAGERLYMQQALEIIHASNEWSGTPPPVLYREHLQRGIAAALRASRREGATAMRADGARIANSVRCRAAENEELINGRAFASMAELSRHSGFLAGQRHAAAEIEDAIRAIPIPENENAAPTRGRRCIEPARGRVGRADERGV